MIGAQPERHEVGIARRMYRVQHRPRVAATALQHPLQSRTTRSDVPAAAAI
ncbi:MAG: hypothetical protein M3R64_12730 [Pseudomonadota bacterium]|nr:hypothetical protein [Pseudomonadota bacterium]